MKGLNTSQRSCLPAANCQLQHLYQDTCTRSRVGKKAVALGLMFHTGQCCIMALHRNGLTTKCFQRVSVGKPTTDLEVLRSQATEDETLPQLLPPCTGDAHLLYRLLLPQALGTSRQIITQPNPKGFIYRAP